MSYLRPEITYAYKLIWKIKKQLIQSIFEQQAFYVKTS